MKTKALPGAKEIEMYNLPENNYELREVMAKNILDYTQVKKINKVIKEVQQQKDLIKSDIKQRNDKKFEDFNKKAHELRKINDRNRKLILKKQKTNE